MGPRNSSRRGRVIASAAAALLLAGGITTIGLGLHAEPPGAREPAAVSSPPAAAPPADAGAPGPASPAGPPAAPVQSVPSAAATPAAPDAPLPFSVPVRVEVPSIGVDAAVAPVGKQANGEVQTPSGEPGSPAGWYQDLPTPGQTGSAVILGHVNSTTSDVGLFYRLHELTAGQTIT